MTNPFIESRNAFLAANPVEQTSFGPRQWGSIRVGDSGPALVLIPGTLGKAEIFWQQIEALKDRAQILALTYPDSHDIEEWSADLEILMDNAGFDRAHILGSSLGGYFVQYFAATRPQRCESIFAANTLSSTEFAVQAPPYALDLANTPIELIRKGFSDGMSKSAAADPSLAPLIGMLMEDVNGGIPEPNLRSRLMAIKYAPPLPRIELPADRVCAIEAVDDPLIPPPIREGVRAFAGPAVSYRFLKGGHFPYVVRPVDYTALLEERLGLIEDGAVWGKGEMRER